MGALFWIKRFLLAAVPLFAILAAVEWFKGSATRDDYLSAAAWALAAAAIFTYTAWRRFRNAQACGMCNDLPAAGKGKKAP
jgi:voltage-gated potassium channel Kch